MLANLHIVNLALIDELDIDFTNGLNILSGETGAGKSIIVGSIGIGLGGRFDSSLLRNELKDGLVELTFIIDSEDLKKSLEEREVPVSDDGTILISRRLKKGRVVNRINDDTVSAAKIKEISELLMNLHAQHEQTTLLKPAKHLEILDSSSKEITVLKEAVRESYRAYISVEKEIEELESNGADRAKRIDFVRYEIDEIKNAHLKVGEDDDLETQYRRMDSAKEIMEIAGEVYAVTGYEKASSAGNQVSRAIQRLREITRYDSEAEGLVELLTDIDTLLNDFDRSLSDYMEGAVFDEGTFDEVSRRLDLINGLKVKYGQKIETILEVLEGLEKEAEMLESYDETLEHLKKKKEQLRKALEEASKNLSEARKKAAKVLCKSVQEAMQELNFNAAEFDMRFTKTSDYTANGYDEAVFLISTNVGEKVRPLNEVASGGELSRVMLAIKATLSDYVDTPTLVFDEIDVGISGVTAQRVGTMMKKLAKTRQILSITHLAQIACCADSQYLIEKKVQKEEGNDMKTITGIRPLDEEGRVMEIARLLGGDDLSKAVVDTAKAMIERERN